MSTVAGTARRRRLISQEMYELVFGTVYTGLMTNLLLAVATLPVLVLLLVTDPATSWPALVLAAPLLAPALTAVFAVFGAFSADGSTAVVRTFGQAWRRYLGRALIVGALATAVTVVLAVDLVFFWGRTAGAVAIPVLATLVAGTIVTAVLALVALPDLPDARLGDVLRAAVLLGARRWYLGAGALLVLGLLGAVVGARPAIGLGFAAAPLLYVVWGTCRYALRPVTASPVTASPVTSAR